MSDGMKVRLISAEQTHDLRHKILRPNQTRDHCSFPGDDAPETVHFGAFKNDTLLGIASLYKENHADLESGVGWRLRGMATDPDVRGQGYGRTLL
ncbi:GNAT family N-acetyltransferase, partial [bacterium AH-315-P07]|nr:GNAT family N-acetyltransferase [bacterium AH-315-P07]